MFKNSKLKIPFLSIVILGTLLFTGSDLLVQNAFAVSTTLDLANTGMACESLGGVWVAPVCTITVVSFFTIPASDTLTIDPGVTLDITGAPTGATAILTIHFAGSVINDGTISVDITGTAAGVNDRRLEVTILSGGSLENNGQFNIDHNGAATLKTTAKLTVSGSFTNNNSLTLDSHANSVSPGTFDSNKVQLIDAIGSLVNNGSITIDNHSTGGVHATTDFFVTGTGTTTTNNGSMSLDSHATTSKSSQSGILIFSNNQLDNVGSITVDSQSMVPTNSQSSIATQANGILNDLCGSTTSLSNNSVTATSLSTTFTNLGTVNEAGIPACSRCPDRSRS